MSKYIEYIENNDIVKKEIVFNDLDLIEKLKKYLKDNYYTTFYKTINSNLGTNGIRRQFRTIPGAGDELLNIEEDISGIRHHSFFTPFKSKERSYNLTFKNYPLLYRILDCDSRDFLLDLYLYLNNNEELFNNDYYSKYQSKYVYDFMKYGEFDSHIPMNYKLWVLRQLLYDIDYSKIDLFNISDLNKQEIVEKVYNMVYDFSSYKEKVKKK